MGRQILTAFAAFDATQLDKRFVTDLEADYVYLFLNFVRVLQRIIGEKQFFETVGQWLRGKRLQEYDFGNSAIDLVLVTSS